jgi:hypothetical protein
MTEAAESNEVADREPSRRLPSSNSAQIGAMTALV